MTRWLDQIMIDGVADRTWSLPTSTPAPDLSAGRFAPPEIFTLEPVASWAGDTTEMDQWLRNVLTDQVQRATWEWFAARLGWPTRDLMAAWTQEWSSVHARARCRASAAVEAELGRLLSDTVRRREPGPVGPVWLGMPAKWTCGCMPPSHVRGIARCEWNDEHGWRPAPADRPGAGG